MKFISRKRPFETHSPWHGYVRHDFLTNEIITATLGLNLILYAWCWFKNLIEYNFARGGWETKIDEYIDAKFHRQQETRRKLVRKRWFQ